MVRTGGWSGVEGISFGVSLLWFYVLTYALIVCLVAALFLGCMPLLQRRSGASYVLIFNLLHLRGVWVLLVAGLAGLPPVLFFGPKLGLLGLLLGGGLLPTLLGVTVSLLLGWAVYFSLGQRSLLSNQGSLALVVRDRRVAGRVSGGAMLVLLFLILGGALLDDWYLAVMWVASL